MDETLGSEERVTGKVECGGRDTRTSATPQKGIYEPDQVVTPQEARRPSPSSGRRGHPADLDRRPRCVAVFCCSKAAIHPPGGEERASFGQKRGENTKGSIRMGLSLCGIPKRNFWIASQRFSLTCFIPCGLLTARRFQITRLPLRAT